MKAFSLYGPPGTGKTTEMLRRMAEALDRGFTRRDIGFYSFTKAAAAEALARLGEGDRRNFATLHAFCFREVDASPLSMVDSYKLRKFGDAAGIPFSGASNDEYGEQMEDGDKYLAIYQLARSLQVSWRDRYYDSDDRPGDHAKYVHCVESYNNWKAAYGFQDFTDLLEQYLQMETPWHGMTALFIDEAQDLSPLQWLVVDKMVRYPQVREVTIAGDDDQAIYEWAGADPHGMAKFSERYDAEVSVLAQSYRVPLAVHDVARTVVARIDNRVKKVYRAAPRPGLVTHAGTGFDASNIAHGEDVLILCRSHTSKREVEAELVSARLPYKNQGGRPGLFESRWADAIRAIDRLQKGKDISAADVELLVKLGNRSTKQYANERNWAKIAGAGWERALMIPNEHVEFFREADLAANPTIKVSTIHAAKGREADRVILHTGITTRTEQAMQRDGDQEARVWYVGVTRAKNRLDIVSGFDQDYPL